MSSHVLIPDTQVKPGVKLDHLIWASKFIKDVKPDKVIIIGDWWDLPSLSSWSKQREAEGQRYKQDIDAGNEALEMFMKGRPKDTEYHFTDGNHENRIERYLDDHPHMDGYMSMQDCEVESHGHQA
jgi:metallophosphoesterase superfamily enzyme